MSAVAFIWNANLGILFGLRQIFMTSCTSCCDIMHTSGKHQAHHVVTLCTHQALIRHMSGTLQAQYYFQVACLVRIL